MNLISKEELLKIASKYENEFASEYYRISVEQFEKLPTIGMGLISKKDLKGYIWQREDIDTDTKELFIDIVNGAIEIEIRPKGEWEEEPKLEENISQNLRPRRY